VDLSLAPTPAVGDSIAAILEEMGSRCAARRERLRRLRSSTTRSRKAARWLLLVGGLSGAFIPVSEDAGMIAAVEAGAMSLEKLEALTCVCSVGIDMVAVPGDTPAERFRR